MKNHNIGFDGRVFLTEEEWRTYLKRQPIRFIRKTKNDVCCFCGTKSTIDNPLQNVHMIGFHIGVVKLGLTPDFLDRDDNIVTAHRKKCNKSVELNFEDSIKYLKDKGLDLPKFLDIIQK